MALTLDRILAQHDADSAAGSTDEGLQILAVRSDAGGTLVSADGDYTPLSVTATGELRTSTTVTINAEKNEDDAHVSGATGNFVLAVRNDAGGSLSSASGDYDALTTDSSGRLWSNAFISGQAADLTIADGGNVISVDDAGGSLTVDGTVDVTDGGGSLTVDDGGLTLSIDDGGASITIDGSVGLTDLVADDAADAGGSLKMGMRAFDGALTAVSATGDRADALSDMYRRQYVNNAANIGVQASAQTIGATESQIAGTPLAGRVRLEVQNLSNASIYVGPTGVTTATGYEIPKGSSLALDAGEDIALYAIAAGAGNAIRVLELA